MAASKKRLPKELEGVASSDDLSKLTNRVEVLEKRASTPAAMVNTLKDVFENDRNIDPVMADYVKKHVDLKPMVESAVDAMDKRLVKAFMKKTGVWVLGAVWSVVLIVITAWVTSKF